MPQKMSWMAAASVLVLCATVSGCSRNDPGESAPGQAAEDFHSALAGSNYEEACSLLTAPALEKLEKRQPGSCPTELAEIDLAAAGEVVSSKTYGRNAQVMMQGDTVFLTLSGTQWKIMGAGCTSRADRPYLCDVEGD